MQASKLTFSARSTVAPNFRGTAIKFRGAWHQSICSINIEIPYLTKSATNRQNYTALLTVLNLSKSYNDGYLSP